MTNIPEVLRRRMVECPTCHGEGKAYYGDNTGYVKCWNPLCMHTGKVPEPAEVWAERNARVALQLCKQGRFYKCKYQAGWDDCTFCTVHHDIDKCNEARLSAALTAVEKEQSNG